MNTHKFLFGQKRSLFTSRGRRIVNDQLTSSTEVKITPKKQHKYSETVLLPRTEFPAQLNGSKCVQRDEYISRKCGFSDLYEWQRKNLQGPDFVLHDGPPYANGIPHMGHAINKILKDITLRHHVMHGKRVHYVPGWDCHGLPIELKAIHGVNVHDPLEIRQRARRYAEEAIAQQKQAFQSWGVMADWRESGCYFTNQSSYVKNQLRQFINLYERGIVFRDFMPVYWSPSSRTALAESELEYNKQHQSKAAIVRLRVANFPDKLNSFNDRTVYALTWTTTPWTLVANQAVAFAASAMYCLAEDSEGNLNVIGEELLKSVESKIGPLTPMVRVEGKELEGTTYFHPLNEKKLPFLAAQHVTMNLGTGLVHTAPAHGPEDFLVAIENNIPVLSVVDIEGRYTEAAGLEFHGLKVLTEGTNKVLERMARDVLHIETLTHSYPYDWRTKQPVVIRASNQWFIDINSLRQKIVDSITDVKVYPECNRKSFTNALFTGIKERPYWCISRQRSWGTPIPVLCSKKTGKTFTNRALVERLCCSIDRYGPDCWWKYSEEELLGSDVIAGLKIAVDDIEKGKDIMDIWFDSGVSWSTVLPEGKANLCLEGYDQFNGWFQSSLITSVALQECPPYRALFVHGFAVDENGLKMSKSVGNVINPEELLLGGSNLQKKPVYGVDVLRWWVANHGCQHTQVLVSKALLDECKQSIHRLRLILRFLLGVVHPYHDEGTDCEPQYRIIDKYMLHLLHRYHEKAASGFCKLCDYKKKKKAFQRFPPAVLSTSSVVQAHNDAKIIVQPEASSSINCEETDGKNIKSFTLTLVYHQMQEHYNNYEYHHAGKTIMHFIANDVSSFYCYLIKDRLYCDKVVSSPRVAAVQVVREIITVLTRTIAPILPHLAEEVWLYHPQNHEAIPLHRIAYNIPESWNDPGTVECVDAALRLRDNLSNNIGCRKTWELSATVEATADDFASLSLLHDEKQSSMSELCEILQLSSITLYENHTLTETRIEVHDTRKVLCERCRRYPATREDNGLCPRCASVLARSASMSVAA